MARTEQLFLSLLRSDNIKDTLFPYLSVADLTAIRAASSACCNLLTKRVFTRVHVAFNSSTFTKPSRVSALSRVGHHIEHLTFYFPHSEATFLPPLIHPLTGEEISFLYAPHTSMTSPLTRPKYANTELGDLLTQQYPPIFHAATNVPSFINALKFVPNLRHLTIRCPGQDARERYRRDTVDYALISLRIAVERAPLVKLAKLSLSSMHPGAFTYLRHNSSFGAVPSSGRRWKQIKKLGISVEAWDFYGPSPGLDHLKIIDDYVRFFSADLEKLNFTWIGHRGPCPLSLAADPLFAPPRDSKKLFNEVTSPMSPLPVHPPRSPMHFPKIRYLQIRNAAMNAPQLSSLITSHRDTVKEFNFDNVVLTENGDWDDALSSIHSDKSWCRSSLAMTSRCSMVTSEGSDDLPSPSAAVAAASKELLDLDLGQLGFSDEEKDLIAGLAEETASIASTRMSVSTKLTRIRSRRRRRKHTHQKEREYDTESLVSCSTQQSKSTITSPSPTKPQEASRSRSRRPKTPPSPTPVSPQAITAPLLIPNPQPVLLQPTVYDPSTRHHPHALSHGEDISPVQRNLEQEQARKHFAEDAAARVSALQKAKATVLSKLSREFQGRKTKATEAVAAVVACRHMNVRQLSTCSREVLDDGRQLSSQSALVPLMLSRI